MCEVKMVLQMDRFPKNKKEEFTELFGKSGRPKNLRCVKFLFLIRYFKNATNWQGKKYIQMKNRDSS